MMFGPEKISSLIQKEVFGIVPSRHFERVHCFHLQAAAFTMQKIVLNFIDPSRCV